MNVVKAADLYRPLAKLKGRSDLDYRRLPLLGKTPYIRLHNVPSLATVSDVSTAIARASVEGVSRVSLEYFRFVPTEQAIVTLKDPHYLRDAIFNLRNLSIGGLQVRAEAVVGELQSTARSRGKKGKGALFSRESLTGDGPDAGIPLRSRAVVVSFLPAVKSLSELVHLLEQYDIERDPSNGQPLVSSVAPVTSDDLSSRYISLPKSTEEASRFVRDQHLTWYKPTPSSRMSRLTARIVH